MHELESRIALLERLVQQLVRRQAQPIGFARSTAAPNDSGPVQTVQGQFDALSLRDGMPVLFHYGYTSAMPIGGDKVIGYLGGERSSPVVLATGHQTYRLTGLAPGEVALYDMWQHAVRLNSAGIAMTGTVTINGDLRVTGAVIAGYGGGDQVGLQTHEHAVPEHAGTSSPPTAGT